MLPFVKELSVSVRDALLGKASGRGTSGSKGKSGLHEAFSQASVKGGSKGYIFNLSIKDTDIDHLIKNGNIELARKLEMALERYNKEKERRYDSYVDLKEACIGSSIYATQTKESNLLVLRNDIAELRRQAQEFLAQSESEQKRKPTVPAGMN